MTSAVIAGVVLLAGGGAWAVGSMLTDDGGSTAASPSTSSSASSSPTDASSPSVSESPSESPSATPSTSPADTTAADDAARAACVGQVRAADGIAKAVAGSALHWKQHTDAYLDKTRGRLTLAQTQKLYAASKAFGLADEKAVAATTKSFMATGAACSDAAKAMPDDAAVRDCTTRLKALGAVRTTGTKVQDEWSAHMRMMADKVHTDAGAYHQIWVKAVTDSRSSLAAHSTAAAAASRAPACA